MYARTAHEKCLAEAFEQVLCSGGLQCPEAKGYCTQFQHVVK